MSQLRKSWWLLLALTSLLFISTNAKALPIALALGIDGSGSISSGDYELQRDAYVNTLTSLLPDDGSVAVGVWQFSSNVTTEFGFTLIDSATKKTALLDAISNMTQPKALTAIGSTIDVATMAITNYGLANLGKTLIDISTDGVNTSGGNPITASANAIAAGIDQVNCIGVGGNANCNFIAGISSFGLAATNFTDFEAALITKLEREIGYGGGGNVPEPISLALFGMGLLGLAYTRRPKKLMD